jgi:hypothetical protein
MLNHFVRVINGTAEGIKRWVMASLVLVAITPLPGWAQYFVLTNLDARQIDFELSPGAPWGASDRLFQRASKKLKEAGFLEALSRSAQREQFKTRLVLSLDVKDLGQDGVFPFLGKTCPGKKIYMQKLELWETFIVKRNPQDQVYGVTWQRSVPLPVILDDVPIERLEADLDRLIGEFIDDYKAGNEGSGKK